ncbi:MAG TPA: galactokinase [Ktedonobacteraceae bacterium]|jgi:galactokinase
MHKAHALPQPARAAWQAFSSAFQETVPYRAALCAAWAPGRVNLIGEHTDYNAGSVLPLAVDRVVALAGRPRADERVRLWSVYFQELATFSLAGLPASFAEQCAALPIWARYVLAVVAEMRRAGLPLSGFDAVLQGDVPVGGGMSSSAALEVATFQACQLFAREAGAATDAALTSLQVAELCQHAEWMASGVRCGILDQACACLGRPGQAIFLDCRSLAYRYVPFATPDLALVVIDSGVRRDLAGSAYNERRRQCEEATRLLSELAGRRIEHLSEVSAETFVRWQGALPALLRRRAGYVLAENRRVLKAVASLEAGRMDAVGALLWQTHAGLRDDYEVSCLELDTLVELARGVCGVLGARMMGGGFGGCTVNLVQVEAVEPLRQAVEEHYQARTGARASLAVCRAAGGPGSTTNPAA